MAAVSWGLAVEYFESGDITIPLIATLLTDLILCFLLIVFVAYQATRKSLKSKRTSKVRSPLNLRILRHLSLLALIPAIVTAVVGTTIIIVLGDRTLSEIRGPIEDARSAAENYIDNQYRQQGRVMLELQELFVQQGVEARVRERGAIRKALQTIHQDRPEMDKLFVVDSAGRLIARGQNSFVFDCDAPATQAIQLLPESTNSQFAVSHNNSADLTCSNTADMGEAEEFYCFYGNGRAGTPCPSNSESVATTSDFVRAVVYRQGGSDRIYSITNLLGFENLFLFGHKRVNLEILNLHIAGQIAGPDALIRQLISTVLQWSIVYVAILVVLQFLLLQVAFRIAKGISKPISDLATVADRVKGGNQNVRFPEFSRKDEVAALGSSIEQMVNGLVLRQRELEQSGKEAEAEKSKFDRVLGTVSAGVIGLDGAGSVVFCNDSAQKLLQVEFKTDSLLSNMAKDFHDELVEPIQECAKSGEVQKTIALEQGEEKILLSVRVAKWQSSSTSDETSGNQELFVISIEDVTQLTRAERERSIMRTVKQVAHDLKSPVQGAQFSQATLRDLLGDEVPAPVERQLTAVSKNLLKVAEFLNRFQGTVESEQVKFVPMDINQLLGEFVREWQKRHPNIEISFTPSATNQLMVKLDRRSMQNVFENLATNATDSINEKQQQLKRHNSGQSNTYQGEIRVVVNQVGKLAQISVSDNGAGLADANHDFATGDMSTRGRSRGYGLTIVGDAVRRHNGTFLLKSGDQFEGCSHSGAQAVVRLPLCSNPEPLGGQDV